MLLMPSKDNIFVESQMAALHCYKIAAKDVTRKCGTMNKNIVVQKSIQWSVADPGFPVGWRAPVRGGVDLRRGHFSVKMYVKTKELGPIGGHVPGMPPLDPPKVVVSASPPPISFIFAYVFIGKCPHGTSAPSSQWGWYPQRKILDPPLK